MTRADVQAGRLLIRQVVETRIGTPLFIAWRTAQRGKALAWFLERLEEPALRESCSPDGYPGLLEPLRCRGMMNLEKAVSHR